MKITVDNFELKLVINKVSKFEYEVMDDPEGEKYTVQVRYVLNGEEINANGSYWMIHDMVEYGVPRLHKMYANCERYPYQFYLFTCTCGEAGCAGLHNPIGVKERRHTIEWRVPSEYTFLSSRFYTFATPMVKKEMKRVVDEYNTFVSQHPDALFDVI